MTLANLAALVLALAPAQESRSEIDVLWAAGQRVEALDAMAALLVRTPADRELRAALVRREVAVHRYAAALEHAADLEEVAAERGYCLYRLGRFEEALLHLDQERADQSLYVFDTLEILGRRDEARAALTRLARARGDDDPEVLVRRARIHAADGEHAAAVEGFRAALSGDAVHAEAWFGLGQSLLRVGERDEARAALERHRELVPLLDALEFAVKSLDLAPNHAPNHAAVGDAERALGRLEAAEGAYRRAAVLAAPHEVVPIALRHARLVEEDRGDVDGSLALLDTALGRVTDVRLYVRKGDLLLAAGRRADAAREFERGLVLRPGDAAIQARLARARESD